MYVPSPRNTVRLVCSILFQRGIYEAESFTKVQKYGLGMQVTTDNGLAEYLKKVLTQLQGLLGEIGTARTSLHACFLLLRDPQQPSAAESRDVVDVDCGTLFG